MSENTERSTASEWSGPERRLAAIFAADIAGYSRAMHADESGAMRALQAMRMIVDRLILVRRGRIANTAGDSVLAEFASVTDAVCCAVAIQRALADAEGDAGHFRLRIGIHIGDIMVHAGDLFGDGVSIAARLQTAADPGALRLSEAAYLQVRGLPDIRFIDLGPQRLKNIARPLRVYAVPPPDGQPSRAVHARRVRAALRPPLGAAAVLATAAGLAMAWPHLVGSERGEAPRVPARPRLSLVVLPLTNQSGDTDQDYLAEQLAEDLSADLARAPGTFVIAHGTAQSYKGRQAEPRAIGRELGVRYVVQGSLRHSAEQVRFAVQLTDVETGASLWADHYDGPRAAVGATQDVLVTQVGRALGVRLLEAATRARARRSAGGCGRSGHARPSPAQPTFCTRESCAGPSFVRAGPRARSGECRRTTWNGRGARRWGAERLDNRADCRPRCGRSAPLPWCCRMIPRTRLRITCAVRPCAPDLATRKRSPRSTGF
ncbi:adenylate/guanylate cyclase domain-containing protein [Methylobacterium sp. WL7]|nr:adenylate/guanylate cyclase domain-containing protein [Methylobacterium sp. WL7]